MYRYKPGFARTLLTALILSCAVALLYSVCPPFWETNDDVSMSMVANGYGVATVGTSAIVFSNAIWGEIVRLLPKIGTLDGYAGGTILVLLATSVACLEILRRRNVHWICGCIVVFLLWFRVFQFPQFTVNAGLLLLTAVVCVLQYEATARLRYLVVGLIFAYFSYIVRQEEFLLLAIVASPILPWGAILRRRAAWSLVIGFCLVLVASHFVDRQAYAGESWKDFWAFNAVRAPLTDYGAAPTVLARPDLLAKYHMSVNDVSLVRYWVFVDRDVANTQVLDALLEDAGAKVGQQFSLQQGWAAWSGLYNERLGYISAAALILFACFPSRRVLLVWVAGFLAIFALGVMGRQGVMRVYYPLFCLFALAPLLTARGRPVSKYAVALLLVVAIGNAVPVLKTEREMQQKSTTMRAEVSRYPAEPLVVWGDAYPFEAIYPVLGPSESDYRRVLFPLGGFTLAPFSVAYKATAAGDGFVPRFLSADGIPIMGGDPELLKRYCAERHAGTLQKRDYVDNTLLPVHRYRCSISSGSAGVESQAVAIGKSSTWQLL